MLKYLNYFCLHTMNLQYFKCSLSKIIYEILDIFFYFWTVCLYCISFSFTQHAYQQFTGTLLTISRISKHVIICILLYILPVYSK